MGRGEGENAGTKQEGLRFKRLGKKVWGKVGGWGLMVQGLIFGSTCDMYTSMGIHNINLSIKMLEMPPWTRQRNNAVLWLALYQTYIHNQTRVINPETWMIVCLNYISLFQYWTLLSSRPPYDPKLHNFNHHHNPLPWNGAISPRLSLHAHPQTSKLLNSWTHNHKSKFLQTALSHQP